MLQKLNNRPFHPDDTDMRPYRPGRPFAPDKDNPLPLPFHGGRGDGHGGNGGNGGGGILSAFLPGQQAALAQQMNNGFGGGEKQWKGILGQTYSPVTSAANFEYGGGMKDKRGGKGDGKNKPNDPTGDGDDMDAYVPDDQFGHQRSMLPMALQQQMSQPVPQQMQMQPQIQGQAMNPQMLLMLRQRLMGGR
jgi:hypothetical protein